MKLFSFLLFLQCSVKSSVVSEKKTHDFQLPAPLFEEDHLYSYLADIKVYGNQITGHLRIKRLSEQECKVVFTNESGFQLMALSFENGALKAHQVFKKLDKKLVLNMLEEDFGLIFYENLCLNSLDSGKYGENDVFCTDKKRQFIYEISPDKLVENILVKRGDKTEVTATFTNYTNAIPDDIKIAHQDVKLSYHLTRIE